MAVGAFAQRGVYQVFAVFLCYVRAAASRVTDGRAGLRQAQPPNSAARNGIWVRTHAVRPYISGCDSITALQQRDVRTRFIASSSRYLLVWDKGACPLVSWARAAAVHPQRIHTNNWLLNIYTESCGRDESRPYNVSLRIWDKGAASLFSQVRTAERGFGRLSLRIVSYPIRKPITTTSSVWRLSPRNWAKRCVSSSACCPIGSDWASSRAARKPDILSFRLCLPPNWSG